MGKKITLNFTSATVHLEHGCKHCILAHVMRRLPVLACVFGQLLHNGLQPYAGCFSQLALRVLLAVSCTAKGLILKIKL